jgi:hypothetical protein
MEPLTMMMAKKRHLFSYWSDGLAHTDSAILPFGKIQAKGLRCHWRLSLPFLSLIRADAGPKRPASELLSVDEEKTRLN